MRLKRRIVTVGVCVACGLALAACGQQIVARVQASDSVHTALTGVFKSPTTRFVVTAQDLPGAAGLADGSFSVVITTSREVQGDQSAANEGIEFSVYHESTDLADIISTGGSEYFRVDLEDIFALASPGEFATVSSELDALAARPNLGYLHDILLGDWVGISTSTYEAVSRQLTPELPPLPSSLSALQELNQNLQKVKQLGLTVSSALMQAGRTWASIRREAGDEYSLNLPLRPFASSLVDELTKPVEAFLNKPSLPPAEISKMLAQIPAGLAFQANFWVSNGLVTKIQAFIPRTSAYLMIDVSHPATPVAAPSGATTLTAANLTALFGDLTPTTTKTLSSGGGVLFRLL
jgi:hypothetical protein